MGILRQAFLEPLHQVHHLGRTRGGFRSQVDGLSFCFLFNQLEHSLPIFVPVSAGIKRIAGDRLDELRRQLELGAGRFLVGFGQFLEWPDLVLIVHPVQQQAAADRTDEVQTVLASPHILGQRHPFHVLHGLGEQLVGFFSLLLRTEIVRAFEIDRIDGAQRHELKNLHGVALRRLQPVQLVRIDADILILGDFVAFHQFFVLHLALTRGAVPLLFDSAAAGRMQLVEVNVLLVDGRVDSYWDSHQAEGDMRRFELPSHAA